jgi:hypothetical protein
MPLVILVGAAACAVWIAPVPARADDATVARFRYERAQEFYRQRRFVEALEEFFLLQRVSPNPRISYNIALCFAQLGNENEAFLAYAGYLAGLPREDDDEGRRAQAEAAMSALAPRVAQLRVDSDPPGASIYVDRVELGSFGTTPRLLAVTPGVRAVRLELPGHEPKEVHVEARAGAEARVDATLVPIVTAAPDTPSWNALGVYAGDGLWSFTSDEPLRFPFLIDDVSFVVTVYEPRLRWSSADGDVAPDDDDASTPRVPWLLGGALEANELFRDFNQLLPDGVAGPEEVRLVLRTLVDLAPGDDGLCTRGSAAVAGRLLPVRFDRIDR